MLEVELTRRKRERKRERMGLLQMEGKVPSFSPRQLSLFPSPFSLTLGVCCEIEWAVEKEPINGGGSQAEGVN